MRKPGGYGLLCQPGSPNVEQDTYTCSHCNKVVFVKPKERPEDLGGLCKVCMGLICPHCVGKGCDPLEKKIERMEHLGRILQEYGLQR